MPGESRDEVGREFFDWFDGITDSDLFSPKPHVEMPIRWLAGSAIAKSEPLVAELAARADQVLGAPAPIVGIEDLVICTFFTRRSGRLRCSGPAWRQHACRRLVR